MLDVRPYKPIIKGKNFDPSPQAGKIPYWADSRTNPKVIGTQAWKDYWEEQIYYCLYGYDTGGLHITGRYYHYLNFVLIDGPGTGKIYPDFIDLHFELFNWWEEILKDKNCAGGIVPKPRRKGLTFFGDNLIIFGHRFIEGYRSCIVGGLDTYVQQFRSKLTRTISNCPNELYLATIINGEEEYITGCKDLKNLITETKATEFFGYSIFKTMQDEAAKLEGEYFNDAILEEQGEFPLADQVITSIGPALKRGEDFIGKFLGLGTGGKMSKGGKTFKSIVFAHKSRRLKVFVISGERYYPPFVRVKNGKYNTPNLDRDYPDLSPEQLLGCEDVVAAKISLMEERALLSTNPDRKQFIQHCQNYPFSLEDIFNSSGSNTFNSDKLNMQSFAIDSLPAEKFAEYILEYVKDEDGNFKQPLQVSARVANSKDKDWEKILIYKHPKTEIRDLDIGGTDSYNQDQTSTGLSLGAIGVLRQNDTFKAYSDNEPGRVPVCIYYNRPPRKEQHWEISLKISIYYNLIGNMMISAESDSCIDYFKKHGGKKYLSFRPSSFDSPTGDKPTNAYGAKMNTYSKPRMVGLLQTWTEDCIIYCWSKLIINDLLTYDEENIGNDWDLADAIGLALMRIVDMRRKPKEKEKESDELEENAMPDFIEWGADDNGVVVPLNYTFSSSSNKKRKNNNSTESDSLGTGFKMDDF